MEGPHGKQRAGRKTIKRGKDKENEEMKKRNVRERERETRIEGENKIEDK